MEDLMKEPVQLLLSEDGLSFMPTPTSVKDIVIPSLNLHGLHPKFETIIETPKFETIIETWYVFIYLNGYMCPSWKNLQK
jgi:hypothetical protein